MLFAVFNCSNKNSAIVSNGPNLRILGLNLQDNKAKQHVDSFTKSRKCETRCWPMSTKDDIQWRSITNTDLTVLSELELSQHLLHEYEVIKDKLSQWNSWRHSKNIDLFEISQSKIRRPYHQLYAEHLLINLKIEQDAVSLMEPQLEQKTFSEPKELNKDDELRGQQWALIAIIGDVTYEKKKEELIDTLGLDYFYFLKCNMEQNNSKVLNESNVDHKELQSNLDLKELLNPETQDTIMQQIVLLDDNKRLDLIQAFQPNVRQTKLLIESLNIEPLVSFHGVSEHPEDLEKLSEDLAKMPEMMHSDIAIVRMYSWLKLSYANSSKIKHTARDPRAREFFKNMRNSQT